ncbi:unnamed protein product [Adineta ricciae]|uniref:Uncharacterized protein n=1 Tax=Adineta ricciae TaxID=249248 RepID=A0A813U862_ADIRI|nr:unnamed protein product [Adineta ricciae]CAF0820092.1 unnamed protein product [Adineta ricciae]
MCDLFQANPWKPLLCTNCHQNRSGHQIIEGQCEHAHSQEKSIDMPSSSSSMHLYEEIMAQYFTVNSPNVETIQSTSMIEQLPTTNDDEDEDEEDSFSDEEQNLVKPPTIEFISNQSMINTQGIVLMGPDLQTKQVTLTKKSKKINLLKKSKSNADECLKKTDINDNYTSKLWWFKVKKANTSSGNQPDLINGTNRSTVCSSPNQQQRVRVLPEINKLTLSEAVNIARRQHLLSSSESKPASKPCNSPVVSTAQTTYGSSIASTTSSSTQSSSDYDTCVTKYDSTYLAAISPIDSNLSLATMLDKTNQLTIERLTYNLHSILDEYKHNLPVARFQPLKCFLYQHQSSKVLSTEGVHFLLLQIFDEVSVQSKTTFDHFLIANQSAIPIIVTTTSTVTNEQEPIEQFIKNLASKLFDSASLPTFNNLSALQNVACRYLSNHVLQFLDIDTNISMQRVKLLDLFWKKFPSLRQIQINEDNERFIFALYHFMRHLCRSDSFI